MNTRRFFGIMKLYNAQLMGQFHGIQGRIGFVLLIFFWLLAGVGGAEILCKELFSGNELNFTLMTKILLYSIELSLIAMFFLCPFVFFARTQIDEMVTLTQYPIPYKWLAVCKLYDLGLSLIQFSFIPLLPVAIKLWLKGISTGHLQVLILWWLLVLCVMAFCVFAGYCWSLMACLVSEIIPKRFVRFGFVLVVFTLFSISSIILLSIFLQNSGTIGGTCLLYCESILKFYLASSPILGCGMLFALYVLLVLTFRFSLWWIERFYICKIYFIKNTFTQSSAELVKDKKYRFSIPFIPRQIQAMCSKELLLLIRNYEFWVFLAMSVGLSGIALINFNSGDIMSFIFNNPGDLLNASPILKERLVVISICFSILITHCGLWTFRFENRDCSNLAFYPASCTNIVYGKALAYFIILMPFLSFIIFLRFDPVLGVFAIFQVLYILAFVYLTTITCVVISGFTVNHNANNLLLSVTVLGRFAYFALIAMEAMMFFFFNILCTKAPSLYILGLAFILFASYILASRSHFFIQGLHTKKRAEGLSHTTGIFHFAFVRKTHSFCEENGRPFWLGLIASIPVFIVLAYVLSGKEGFIGLPFSLKITLFIWLPLVAFICFWQKIQRGVRLLCFILLLIALPAVFFVNSYNFKGYFSKYPSRLIHLITDYPVRLDALIIISIKKPYQESPPNEEKSQAVPSWGLQII